MLYFYIALVLLAETTAMSLLKEYSQVHKSTYLLGGIFCYMVVSFLLVQSFTLEGMGMVNVIWSAFSVIFVESVGVYTFHERITHTQICGIGCALIGVVILKFPF